MTTAFHEVLFPLDIALKSAGGPQRKTEIVAVGSGREERNARWAHSCRRYDAGYGVKTYEALSTVVAFFEERRGRLYGFRWRDRIDWQSCAPGGVPAETDQAIGEGDGERTAFPLVKTYGSAHAPYARAIAKPVAGSVSIAIDGEALADGWSVDTTSGVVTFATAPAADAAITAGFRFDVPVRFDTDRLDVNLTSFAAGDIPAIPLVEIRL
jgi:uncharacterized protein (TIGR02217 family)